MCDTADVALDGRTSACGDIRITAMYLFLVNY